MNLDELRSVQSKERQKDSLQNLRPSFYQEVGEYIADLEDERDRVAEGSDNPFSSPEVSRLTDEIETAKDVVEAIYERRMGKLVKQASLAAAGMAADDEGLTAEEADLFDDLVDRIESNKSRVLDVLEGLETETGAEPDARPAVDAADADTGSTSSVPADAAEPGRPDSSQSAPETDPVTGKPLEESDTAESAGPADGQPDDGPPVPPQEPPADADLTPDDDAAPDAGEADSSGVTPADVMGGEGPELGDADGPDEPGESSAATQPNAGQSSEPATGDDSTAEGQDSADVDRVTVRITRDIGSILGVDDREYSLATDDIVTLPEQNADPLLEQEAAEPLE